MHLKQTHTGQWQKQKYNTPSQDTGQWILLTTWHAGTKTHRQCTCLVAFPQCNPRHSVPCSSTNKQSLPGLQESHWIVITVILWFWTCSVIFGNHRDFASRSWPSADYVQNQHSGASLMPTWLSQLTATFNASTQTEQIITWHDSHDHLNIFDSFAIFHTFMASWSSGHGRTTTFTEVHACMMLSWPQKR